MKEGNLTEGFGSLASELSFDLAVWMQNDYPVDQKEKSYASWVFRARPQIPFLTLKQTWKYQML